MEKPGMDRSGKSAGARLLKAASSPPGLRPSLSFRRVFWLALVLRLLCAPPLPAQTPPPRVIVESAPGELRNGGLWTLIFLVDHPQPAEVEVRPPPFPLALVPSLVRREPRIVGTERWTAVEYRFILRGSGRLSLAPFEIISPRGSVLSSPLDLDVQGPEGEGDSLFRLVWENIPPLLEPGKPAELYLGIPGWDPRRPPVAPGLLLPEAPEGFILERLRPEPGDGEAGRALRLRLISLSGDPFRLPPRTVRSGNLRLEIPPLVIPGSPSGAPPERPDPPPLSGENAAPPPFVPVPFPELEALSPGPPPVPFLRPAYQKVLRPVREFWDTGDRVRALAELRGQERRHPAGPFLRPLRRNMEASLGFEDTPDEPWRPRPLLRIALLGTLGPAALILLWRLLRSGKRGTMPPSGKRAAGPLIRRAGPVFLLLLAGFSLWGLFDGRDLPGEPRSGVLRATAARRVPDFAGTVTVVFQEGQPVRGRSPGGSWVWVEIPASPSEAGWIPEGDIIFYTPEAVPKLRFWE